MNKSVYGATGQWLRSGTALSALFPRTLPEPRARRFARLALEGALSALVALFLASNVEAGQAAVVVVFFTAAALVHRFDGLLDENRNAIYGGRARGANARTAWSMLALFAGVFVTCSAAVLLLPEARTGPTVVALADAAKIGSDTLLTRRFGSFPGLFAYNAGVLVTFCVVSLVYRTLGALLALTWNAGLWATVLSLLTRRAMTGTAMSKGAFVAVASLAVLPHLVLEAAAYVTASLAAIFLSRGALLYSFGDARLREIARAAGRMLGLSLGLLAAAALLESTLPRLVLSGMR